MSTKSVNKLTGTGRQTDVYDYILSPADDLTERQLNRIHCIDDNNDYDTLLFINSVVYICHLFSVKYVTLFQSI